MVATAAAAVASLLLSLCLLNLIAAHFLPFVLVLVLIKTCNSSGVAPDSGSRSQTMVPQYNFQLQKGPECAGAYLKYWQEQVKVAHKQAIFNGMKQKFCRLF